MRRTRWTKVTAPSTAWYHGQGILRGAMDSGEGLSPQEVGTLVRFRFGLASARLVRKETALVCMYSNVSSNVPRKSPKVLV